MRELKNRLSAYLREVAAGEVVLVTDRGRVVAELRRPTVEGLQSPAEQALGRLVAAGVLMIGLPQDPGRITVPACGSPARARHCSTPSEPTGDLYAESSPVLWWLLDEPGGDEVRLAGADGRARESDDGRGARG